MVLHRALCGAAEAVCVGTQIGGCYDDLDVYSARTRQLGPPFALGTRVHAGGPARYTALMSRLHERRDVTVTVSRP
jgi:hypothetical protein